MRRPPRKKNAPIITKRLLYRVLFSASIIVIGTLFIYVFALKDEDMSRREQTMVSVFSFLFVALLFGGRLPRTNPYDKCRIPFFFLLPRTCRRSIDRQVRGLVGAIHTYVSLAFPLIFIVLTPYTLLRHLHASSFSTLPRPSNRGDLGAPCSKTKCW